MEHEQQHPTGPTFDTLKAAEALQKAGFTGVQAKAVTQTIVEAQANLATKADIREMRADMKAEFKTLRAEIKADFKVLQTEVQALAKIVSTLEKLIWGVTMPLAGGAFLALLGFLIDLFFLSR